MRLTKMVHTLMTPETGVSQHPDPVLSPRYPLTPRLTRCPSQGLGMCLEAEARVQRRGGPPFCPCARALATLSHSSFPMALPGLLARKAAPGRTEGWWGCRGGGGGRRLGGGQAQGGSGGGWPGSTPRLTARHDSGTNRKNHTYHMHTCKRL